MVTCVRFAAACRLRRLSACESKIPETPIPLLAFTTAAHANPAAKPVEVVNDPQTVEVINAPGVQDVNVVVCQNSAEQKPLRFQGLAARCNCRFRPNFRDLFSLRWSL